MTTHGSFAHVRRDRLDFLVLPEGERGAAGEGGRRAVEHLAHFGSLMAHDNAKAANCIVRLLLNAVERLADLPSLGRPGRVMVARELVVPGARYVIPYRPRRDRVEVVAVVHGRRQWPERLLRL